MSKTALAILLLMLIPALSMASSVWLRWDSNTEEDMAGYKTYYRVGNGPFRKYTSQVHRQYSSYQRGTVSGLNRFMTHYFAVTAFNTAGLESSFSNIVTVAGQQPPKVVVRSIRAHILGGRYIPQ